HDELKDRVRMVYEIPMQGYNSNSVRENSRDSWVVNLDLVADEYYHAVLVKRALTRYAAQTLYAPLRTVEALPGIHPLPLRLPAHITTLYPSEPLDIRPLAAWGRGEYSVVALRVRNTGNGKVVTDPRVLAGRFVAATFQHRWLGPAGQPEDTTTLYLVMQGRPEAAFIAEPPITVKKGG
ncbi:TIGR03749 family integrating conjugative element protein, partial [Salmonella enterica]|nr:TIGR03749 family integrating conjugative element protein [Salmonella enterica]